MAYKELNKKQFLIKNLLRGFLYFVLLIIAFLIVKHSVDIDYWKELAPFHDDPGLMYLIFTASELLFDLIPPEVFMMWSLRFQEGHLFIGSVALLAVLSYWAAFAGFYVGKHMHGTRLQRYLTNKLLPKYESYVNRYGAFFVIVAATTPFPYSAISLLIGSADYSTKKYLLYSLTRFIRFAVYSWILWETNKI